MPENIEGKVSFCQLCERYGRIEIPIIQRDYAQGRVEQEGKFKPFLEVLLNALKANPVVLDFIYGTTEGEAFLPLDGQQRLTTLFLLHAYLAIRLDLGAQERAFLTRFTYETRFSSHDFCKKLADWKVPDKVSASTNWSKLIGDVPWYRPRWDQDPTIKSMLHALDQMADKLSEKSEVNLRDFWKCLMDPEHPCVTFHLLPLDRLGLSDDLYIKMNARGVALTPFENFKASLEKRILKEKWAFNNSSGKSFSELIDGYWLESFWKHFPNDFDHALTSFIVNTWVYSQLLEQENPEEQKRIFGYVSRPETLEAENFTQADFEVVCNDLATISKLENRDWLDLPVTPIMWDLRDKQHVPFEIVCLIREQKYNPRVIFFAQLCFCKQAHQKSGELDKVPAHAYADWIRVVRNLLLNTVVDSPSSFRSALKRIQALAFGCLDIYRYLAQQNNTTGFAEAQFKEEVEKANAILVNTQFREVIHALEDTDFCKGNLSTPMYYARNNQNELEFNKLSLALSIIQREFTDSFGYFAKKALLTIRDGQYFIHRKHSWSYAVDRDKYFPFTTLEEICDFWRTNRDNPIRDYFKEYFEGLEKNTSQQLVDIFLKQENKMDKKWRRALIEGDYMLNCKCLAFQAEEDFAFVLRTQRDQNPIKVPPDTAS